MNSLIKVFQCRFLDIKFIGLYLVSIGLLVFLHMEYIKGNANDIGKVFSETIDSLLSNFSNSLNGTKISESMGGGMIGAAFGAGFYKLFSVVGTYIVSSVLMALGIVFMTGIDLIGILLKPFKRRKKKEKMEELEHIIL